MPTPPNCQPSVIPFLLSKKDTNLGDYISPDSCPEILLNKLYLRKGNGNCNRGTSDQSHHLNMSRNRRRTGKLCIGMPTPPNCQPSVIPFLLSKKDTNLGDYISPDSCPEILLNKLCLRKGNGNCNRGSNHRIVTHSDQPHHLNMSGNRRRTGKLCIGMHTPPNCQPSVIPLSLSTKKTRIREVYIPSIRVFIFKANLCLI